MSVTNTETIRLWRPDVAIASGMASGLWRLNVQVTGDATGNDVDLIGLAPTRGVYEIRSVSVENSEAADIFDVRKTNVAAADEISADAIFLLGGTTVDGGNGLFQLRAPLMSEWFVASDSQVEVFRAHFGNDDERTFRLSVSGVYWDLELARLTKGEIGPF